MSDTLLLGAVAYDEKVVSIWDGFQRWFRGHGLDLDYILFSNYERQVESHFAGQVHVAWNSPLAWLQTLEIASGLGRDCHAIAMRDTDRDLRSVVAVRSDSSIRSIEDLDGAVVGVGAADSPQATLIPLEHLAGLGMIPEQNFQVRRFDVLFGKHGDHVGGERKALEALVEGEVSAACLIEGNYRTFTRNGMVPAGLTRVLTTTDEYDHCNFTVLEDAPAHLVEVFHDLLLSMNYQDPEVRPLLEMEGLHEWKPGRTEKYALLSRAVQRFGAIDKFVKSAVTRCA